LILLGDSGGPMIKRIVEISSEPAHLSVKLEQLHIRRHEPDSQLVATIPCEDIGMIVVDNARTTYSHHALGRLMAFGAAVVVCGGDHLPAGIMVPIGSNTELVPRLRDQIEASKPTRKNLWKQIVTAKVRAQAAMLESGGAARKRLTVLAGRVRSGDPTNVEAQAAKVYWGAWLDGTDYAEGFRRDTDGDGINALLNYGYAVLRAAVARALVSGGLATALGLHHRNRSNAFCLADDLVEPLRPMTDAVVRELARRGRVEIGRDEKKALLGVLHQTVAVNGHTGPLMVALHRYTASLTRCLSGEERKLLIPVSAEDGR